VYFLMEREGSDCTLYQVSQVKALPGRLKTDLDSAWLAKVTERGSLAGAFVPPEEIRRHRTHTRYRGPPDLGDLSAARFQDTECVIIAE
jgi:hypothetical protein